MEAMKPQSEDTPVSPERLRELIEVMSPFADGPDVYSTNFSAIVAALRELQRLREQVRVPKEPTDEMLEAMSDVFRNGGGTVIEAYRAMIAASQEDGQ